MNELHYLKTGLGTVALAIACTSSAMAGDILNAVLKTKELKVATNSDYKPQSFLNDRNELDGFDIDVSKEVARRLGVKATFVTPGWEVMTSGNWSGRWHMVVGSMTPTKKRAEILDFPAVYYFSPAAFAVHKDAKIQKIADLSDKTVGVQSSSTYQNYLDHNLVIDAVGVPKFTYQVKAKKVRTYGSGDADELDDLAVGPGVRIDAVLQSMPTIAAAIKNGRPLRLLGQPVFYEPLAIATDKGDKEFGDRIAQTVSAMKSDGTMKKLSEKWYGIDYTTIAP